MKAKCVQSEPIVFVYGQNSNLEGLENALTYCHERSIPKKDSKSLIKQYVFGLIITATLGTVTSFLSSDILKRLEPEDLFEMLKGSFEYLEMRNFFDKFNVFKLLYQISGGKTSMNRLIANLGGTDIFFRDHIIKLADEQIWDFLVSEGYFPSQNLELDEKQLMNLKVFSFFANAGIKGWKSLENVFQNY